MNLNKLRTFVHVARCGSVSRAAEELFRTQPAISSALRDLEKETGLVLFERRNARVYLTREGEELYAFSQQRIDEMDDKAARLRENLSELSGVIRLGILSDFCGVLGPDIVADFRRLLPRVQFRVKSLSMAAIEEALLNGEADFALMIDYSQRQLFDIVHYKTFHIEPIGSPGYLETVAPVTRYPEILKCDLVGATLRLEQLRLWFRKNGFPEMDAVIDKVSPVATLDVISELKGMLIKGLGIGMLFRELVEDEIDRGELVRIFPDALPINVGLDISRRKTRSPSLLMDKFADFMALRSESNQIEGLSSSEPYADSLAQAGHLPA